MRLNIFISDNIGRICFKYVLEHMRIKIVITPLRCPPLAARRLALSRLSPPGALRCTPRHAERHVDTEELQEQC
eukprot:6214318-Pleurochrysis_carterae.AAC.1